MSKIDKGLEKIKVDGNSYNNTELAKITGVTSMAVGKQVTASLFSLYKMVRLSSPEYTKEEILKGIISFLIEEGSIPESEVCNCFNEQLQKKICEFEKKLED